MDQQDREQLFNDWAESYDRTVQGDDDFPFGGYGQVIDQASREAGAEPGMTVLDIGIGTGNLAGHFVRLGCQVWGIDFSAEMLARAREKFPQVTLVQASILGNWPKELERRFDRIVSGYVMHEFDLATKVKLLQRLSQHHLAERGYIVIGDIAFPTSQEREQAHKEWADIWDEEEHYWAADEAIGACKSAGLQVTYKPISRCGGVFIVEPTTLV